MSTLAAPTIPGPDPAPRRPKLALPAGSCDCHAHIFGPQSRYPLVAARPYTPPDCPLPSYLEMLRVIGVERAVLVQPSVYGTDNSLLVDALASKTFALRGIAVVDDDISDAELERLNAAGVRGVRLNLRKGSTSPAEIAPRFAARVAPFGWHLQFRIRPEDFTAARPMIEALPVDVVIDHFGAVPVQEGIDGPSFRAILGLLETSRCWIKLSAPMRMSNLAHPYEDVLPFVDALVKAAPERLVWGTDWPHTTMKGAMPNDGDLCDLLARWLPDAALMRAVLVDNPARLYGF
jgi:predicted TIM-barrel fold metal-dependent hydrolase